MIAAIRDYAGMASLIVAIGTVLAGYWAFRSGILSTRQQSAATTSQTQIALIEQTQSSQQGFINNLVKEAQECRDTIVRLETLLGEQAKTIIAQSRELGELRAGQLASEVIIKRLDAELIRKDDKIDELQKELRGRPA